MDRLFLILYLNEKFGCIIRLFSCIIPFKNSISSRKTESCTPKKFAKPYQTKYVLPKIIYILAPIWVFCSVRTSGAYMRKVSKISGACMHLNCYCFSFLHTKLKLSFICFLFDFYDFQSQFRLNITIKRGKCMKSLLFWIFDVLNKSTHTLSSRSCS